MSESFTEQARALISVNLPEDDPRRMAIEDPEGLLRILLYLLDEQGFRIDALENKVLELQVMSGP